MDLSGSFSKERSVNYLVVANILNIIKNYLIVSCADVIVSPLKVRMISLEH